LKKNKTDKKQTFEDAFKELKAIVDKIEKTENNLEDMVDLIEKGMSLSKYCQDKIDNVHDKIEIIKDKYNN
tara:strand:+ start:353 stop:565 length:213 start_codon:yes stop_codon:yes gene_type:complete